MSSSFVTVVHGTRQYKVPCTPGMIMNEVLSAACLKAGLDPDTHALRHGKSGRIDLSLPFRLTSLHGGAKLDLLAASSSADASINVALDLTDTVRKVALVPARSTLWTLLQHFEENHQLSITNVQVPGTDGQSRRLQPVVIWMQKKYASDEELKQTSLAALGIKSGSAVFKVSFQS